MRLQLTRHELRALIVLIGRSRLTPIERLDLAGALPELERALLAAAHCHDSRKPVMTARMSKKPTKSREPIGWKRARAVSLQLYLSAREKRALSRIARERKLSVADVIRGWIRQAEALKALRAISPARTGRKTT